MAHNFNLSKSDAKAFVDSFANDLSDEQLQIALDVAATAESIDDFKRQFEHAATDALISSIDSS
jgi:hypothetical protein